VIKIKQGYYNYSYVHVQQGKFAPDESKFEGSFSQTRNTYDIIIYHRAMGARADEIVGYYSREFNGF
jgi:hypothetical protein